MTPEEKLRKAIEEAVIYETDEEPIMLPPFEYWIELRMAELWTVIKSSKTYPEKLIDEWEFLERTRRKWQDESI